MTIAGIKYEIRDVFDSFSTVPDCFVIAPNKIGGGHGEAKFYIASKDVMHSFYGAEGFSVKCIMLKSDLLSYLEAAKNEYFSPTFTYGEEYRKDRADAPSLSSLWAKRKKEVQQCPEVLEFYINDQNQLQGPRGYVNSDDAAYKLIREISLPNCSFISAYKLADKHGEILYYWKLFLDFDLLQDRVPLALTYGRGNETIEQVNAVEETSERRSAIQNARIGQGKYREELLNECPLCPITKISDDRLLIASHIKPWAASTDEEKIDPHNGFILSPLYDKLFDRGFITFTKDKKIVLSQLISDSNYRRIGIKNGDFFEMLPMGEKRAEYLEFHQQSVFKGIIG